jgi:hypothetical protein
MTRFGTVVGGLAAALSLYVTTSAPAEAGRDRHARTQPDFVVAESRFGNGTVTGPVRASRHGYEVRLPGGTWIECRRSCSETLRVETVDFWQNQGRGRMDNEGGLFGPLTIHRNF